MTRKNIFDILHERLNISYEIKSLESLCEHTAIRKRVYHNDSYFPDFTSDEYTYEDYTLESYVDKYCFAKWKNRNRCINCQDMRTRLHITSLELIDELSNESIYIYLEYLANILELCSLDILLIDNLIKTETFDLIHENLLDIINLLNQELKIFKNEQKVLLVEKNASSTAVAEIVEPELAYQVIEYNHYLLKGDIESKKRILKSLAEKIEPMRNQLKQLNSKLEDNTFYLLNKMNIRHNNIEGKNAIPYVQNLSDEELESWYDETYQMILLCILEYDNIERNKKVTELKRIIENKWGIK